jgi:uncharacterized membrane protein YdjX (TVP38/TMEM64 family)
MDSGLARFMQVFAAAGVSERVFLAYPEVSANGQSIDTMIHSKVMIVDDTLLRVGSANLNNRSFGLDTECDLAFEAGNAGHRESIAGIRNRLLGHFCGVAEAEVSAALVRTRSLIKTAQTLTGNGHRLAPIELGKADPEHVSTLEEFADPERPISPPEFLKTFVGERPRARRIGRLAKVIGFGLVIMLLVLAWRYTPLMALTDPRTIGETFARIAAMPLAPAIVLAVFVLGGLIVFPVTLLIAVTAATFGPWLGFTYAGIGAVVSAVVGYGVGTLIGRGTLEYLLGPRLNRIRRAIMRRGVLAVATVRMVPVAPFTVMNLAAGASRIPLLDFVLGTVLGLLPGLILMSALGHQIFSILTEPTPTNVILFILAVLAWIGVSLTVQAVVTRARSAKA